MDLPPLSMLDRAYDATKGFQKDLSREDLKKRRIMDKVSMLVDALIIASLIKGSVILDQEEDEEEDLTFRSTRT